MLFWFQKSILWLNNLAGIYMLKVNNRSTRTRCEICSKLTIKIPERRHWRLWTNFTPCSSVSIVNFEHVIAGSVFRMYKMKALARNVLMQKFMYRHLNVPVLCWTCSKFKIKTSEWHHLASLWYVYCWLWVHEA